MADNYVEGVVASNEELWLTDAQGTLVQVLGLKEIKEPSYTVAEEEDTDMESGGTKVYLPGLGDWSTFQAVVKHRPGSPTHLLITEHLLSKRTRPFKVVLRADNDGSTVTGEGEIALLGYDKPSRANGSISNATLTGRVRRYEEGAVAAPGTGS